MKDTSRTRMAPESARHSDDEVSLRRGLEDESVRNFSEMGGDLQRTSTHSILRHAGRECRESREPPARNQNYFDDSSKHQSSKVESRISLHTSEDDCVVDLQGDLDTFELRKV